MRAIRITSLTDKLFDKGRAYLYNYKKNKRGIGGFALKHAGLKIALTVSAAVTFGLALAGCSGGGSDAHYDHIVTFDYNIGTLSDMSAIENQYLGVMNESLIAMQPGYNEDFKLRKLEGYDFEGWYLPEKDAEGNPVRGEDERVRVGEKWNFATGRVTEEITLYANFVSKSGLTVLGKAEVDGEITEVAIDDHSKKAFETLFQGSVGKVIERPAETFAPTASGYIFVDYYADENLTEVFKWPCTLEENRVTVYAKFRKIETWVYASTAEEFVNAIASDSDIRVMADLDFTGVTWKGNYDYSGTIEGNNRVISNISCTIEGSKEKTNYGLFGRLGETFKVSDLTFENASLTFRATTALVGVGAKYQVSGFADSIARGASLTNFRFSGTVAVTKNNLSIQVETYKIRMNRVGEIEGITVTLPADEE